MEVNPELEDAVDTALIQLEKGLAYQAMGSLNKLLEIYPKSYEVHYGIGTVHAAQGRHEKAIEWFDRALTIYPYSINALFNKATACQKLLDLPNSIRSYQRVVALGDPKEKIVQEARSFIAMISAQVWKDQRLTLDSFLQASDLFHEAFAMMEKSDWQAALVGFRASVAINRNNAPSQGNIGLCLSYLGRKAEALAAFDRALEIDPDYQPARSNRDFIQDSEEGVLLDNIGFKTINYSEEKFEEDQYKY